MDEARLAALEARILALEAKLTPQDTRTLQERYVGISAQKPKETTAERQREWSLQEKFTGIPKR